jgi:hypothetical protein
MSKHPNWTFVTSKQVWMDKSLSIEAKAIWHILSAWRDHKSGESYPNVWTLQQVSGMGRNRVDLAIKQLIEAGAIKRRMERIKRVGGVCGSKAIYSVTKLSEWVGKDIYTKNPETQVSGAPGSGGTRNQRVSVSHSQSLNHQQSLTHPLSPAELAASGLRLSESESEAFLEGLGFGSSVAASVWARMESAGWLDANRKPFANRPQLESYIERLAQTMTDAMENRSAPRSAAGW